MARKIIWTQKAREDRKRILAYWKDRNKSDTYSKKLNQLFKHTINIIAEFPRIGKPTNDKNARIKVVKDYLIIYQESETTIFILTIWDSRQNPDKLKISP